MSFLFSGSSCGCPAPKPVCPAPPKPVCAAPPKPVCVAPPKPVCAAPPKPVCQPAPVATCKKACKACPPPKPVEVKKKPRCPCGVDKDCCEECCSALCCGCCDEEDFADETSYILSDIITVILIAALLYVGYTLATGGKLVIPTIPSYYTKFLTKETLAIVGAVSVLLFSVSSIF